MITLKQARAIVEKIEEVKRDDELAHILEDALYKDVIAGVSRSTRVPREIREVCKEALKTKEIEFGRWCA